MAVLAVAAPAFADPPQDPPHVAVATALVQRAGLEAEDPMVAPTPDATADAVTSPRLALTPPEVTAGSGPVMPAPAARHAGRPACAMLSSCGYHRVLGYLVITRDVDIPGAPGVALRLLPTAHALAGDSNKPIVVRPLVTGAGSAYGLDIAARF